MRTSGIVTVEQSDDGYWVVRNGDTRVLSTKDQDEANQRAEWLRHKIEEATK